MQSTGIGRIYRHTEEKAMNQGQIQPFVTAMIVVQNEERRIDAHAQADPDLIRKCVQSFNVMPVKI